MIAAVKDRLSILVTNATNSYRVQTAYFFENWVSLASTMFYVLTMLLFIKIIYSNVNTFAGYTQNEMLFFILFGQLNFYTDWIWNTNNIDSLIDSVRSGELDLILSKPIPSLFFVTFRDISLIDRLKDGVPNMLLISLLIDWSKIHTSWDKVFAGLIIFICGQAAWHCFRFLFALPVFFVGQSKQLFNISRSLGSTNNVPLEGFTGSLRTIFISIIPALVATQISTSVMLGKSDSSQMLFIAISVAISFLILKQIGWIISLRHYSSASS